MSCDFPVTIRAQQPGDLGYVACRHGALYAKEYDFDMTFEGYVLETLVDYVQNYSEDTHGLWMAAAAKELVGCVGVVGRESRSAQLRWLLVEPGFRRRGLGSKLVRTALNFCREHAFDRVFLWTTAELDPARRLYERYGFERTETVTHVVWGRGMTEERWDLVL